MEKTEDPKIHSMKQKFTNVPLVKKVNKKMPPFDNLCCWWLLVCNKIKKISPLIILYNLKFKT